MKKYFLLILIGLTVTISFSACKNSEQIIIQTAKLQDIRIQGTILNEYTGTPVKNAIIRVSNTTENTLTDTNGKFDLFIPAGNYELRVSHSGYETLTRSISLTEKNRLITEYNLNLRPEEDQQQYTEQSNGELDSTSPGSIHRFKEENDSLKQVIKKMKMQSGEISDFPEPADEDARKLIDYYINGGLKCGVVNPGDIILEDTGEEGLLRLQEPVELEVINRYLGYRILVDLEGYAAKQYGNILGVNSEAHYYFEELIPADAAEKNRWEKNREHEFKGSLRHFLIAMASSKSPFYFGYRTYSGTFVSTASAMAFSKSSVSDVEVVKKDFMIPVNRSKTAILSFDDELRVEYIKKGVRDPYDIMGLDTYPYKTSWLSLNGKLAEFTHNGEFLDPSAVQVKGSWRYTPVCGMLPSDYLPEPNTVN